MRSLRSSARRSDVSRRADRAGPRSRYRARHGHAVGVRDRFRAQHVVAAAESAAGIFNRPAIWRAPGRCSAAASLQRGHWARCAPICAGTALRVGEPRPLGHARRRRCARRSRFTSAISSADRRSVRGWGRYQVSPLSPGGNADRRPHDDGGVDRGAVRDSAAS